MKELRPAIIRAHEKAKEYVKLLDFLTSNHPQYPVLSKDLKRLEATKTEKEKK